MSGTPIYPDVCDRGPLLHGDHPLLQYEYAVLAFLTLEGKGDRERERERKKDVRGYDTIDFLMGFFKKSIRKP